MKVQRCLLVAAFLSAAPAAAKATAILTSVPAKSNQRPRQRICSAGICAVGSTNCGRKARKKSATLGFRMLTSIAARNSRQSDAGGVPNAQLLLDAERSRSEMETVRREVARMKVQLSTGKRY